MNISEIFYSIQGEGRNIGKPSIFIRTAGCNLRCAFCDTKYTWDIKEAKEMTTEQLVEAIKKYNCKHIVITGGEPLMWKGEIDELIFQLKDYTFEIETNGTIAINRFSVFDRSHIQINVSPKLENSGNATGMRLNYEALQIFAEIPNVIFKFVVDDEKDIFEILKIIEVHKIPNDKVYLMPEGVIDDKEKAQMIIELCKTYQFNFCPRLHIQVYGNQRGI